MKLNQVYVINLNSDNDKIIEKIHQVDWGYETQYYIYNAVNGWDLDNEEDLPNFRVADWWKIDSENTFYNREVKPGEIGCTLSHYKCIKDAFDSGYENILILEEDFKYLGKFPTVNELFTVPKDASIIYLGRKQQWEDSKEEKINKNVTKVGYSYNNHAYIVTRKGMEEIINSDILMNIIAIDEIYPAMNRTSDRQDAVKVFSNDKFNAYSLNNDYFDQTSNPKTSSTESPKKIINSNFSILDDNDWDKWSEKYINKHLIDKKYDLIIDEPAPHIYLFPLFNDMFCKELIELSEQYTWTTDRHDFYPTTDNLLEVLGMKNIYNKVINKYVRPLAIDRFQLEGKSWDHLTDESFIIRYKTDEQPHLDIHHDHSNITTLVNLNPNEFKGGGTWFPKYNYLANPTDIGVCTLHPGNITHKHGARPITEGTRYVVVSFIKSQDHK